MDYGTQLVALCVVLVVTIEFFQYRRVKLLSTELFEGFLGLSIFCIVCDIGCIYASFHPQYFSILINRIIHQFFLVVAGIFVYMVAHFIYPVADGVAVVALVLPLVRGVLRFGYSHILNRLVK